MKVLKSFLGIFFTLLLLAAGTLGVLAIWNIYPVSWTVIWKTLVTILVSSLFLSLIWQACYTFFRKEKHQNDGKKAHRMN